MIYGVLGFLLAGALRQSVTLKDTDVDLHTLLGAGVMVSMALGLVKNGSTQVGADQLVAVAVSAGVAVGWMKLWAMPQLAALGTNMFVLCVLEGLVVQALVDFGVVGDGAYFYVVAPTYVLVLYAIYAMFHVFAATCVALIRDGRWF